MKLSLIPYALTTILTTSTRVSAFQLSSSSTSLSSLVSSTAIAASSARATSTRLFSTDSMAETTTNSIKGPELPPIPSTAKRLVLVRHGEVINPGGDRPVYYGSMDVSLSDLGKQEAKVAAEYLKQFELQHVAASPLSRAKFGANEVLSRQNSSSLSSSKIKIFDGFTELDRGEWCGMTKDEIGIDLMSRFDSCDEDATPTNGESYPTLKERVLQARDELLDITDCGKASTVVSHLQVTRSMLSDALSIPTHEMYTFKIATASVACVDFCTVTGEQTVHFQNFKPDVGLSKSIDGAN
jgi:broad specificity phosphatase PhoE